MLFDGVPNSRSLGGLDLRFGGKTKDGVFYRSSSLQSITPEGLEQLAATPIGVVADMRTAAERQMAPDKPTNLKMVDLSVAVGDMSPTQAKTSQLKDLKPWEGKLAGMLEGALPSLGTMYEEMLRGSADKFAGVASLVAQVKPGEENAVLVHCTAGKDRTGVSVALILDTVGVDRDVIIQNYADSEKYLAGPWADGMLDKIKQMGVPIEPKLRALVTTTPPEAIEKALAWVKKHHGSSADYLRHGGLLDSQIDSLGQVLT